MRDFFTLLRFFRTRMGKHIRRVPENGIQLHKLPGITVVIAVGTNAAPLATHVEQVIMESEKANG